tara:strand:- start:5969 stop:6814 length:846 start_codon:yes stop_codon:yes gene_type:complete
MRKRVTTKDGVSINYQIIKKDNKKPTLVFLHGLGGNVTEFKVQAKAAQRKGYSTLSLDLRGHGFSSIPEEKEKYSLDLFANDIRTVIQKEKLKNFILVGHSFGGSLSIVYITKFNTLLPKAMILIESTYRYPFKKNHELNYSAALCYSLRKFIKWGLISNKKYPRPEELDLTQLGNENVLYQIYDEIYHTPIKSIFQCLDASRKFYNKKKEAMKKTLRTTKIPTLIVAGDIDQIINISYSREIARLISDSTLKVFKGAGHQIPLQNGEELNAEILTFLSAL